jgi:hypothetical protein
MTRRQFFELRDLLAATDIQVGVRDAIVQKLYDIRCETPEPLNGCTCGPCERLRAIEAAEADAVRS